MSPNNSAGVDLFINKMTLTKDVNEDNDLFKYDTIIFDADETIWDIFDLNGDRLPAKDTNGPFYKKDENTLTDSIGNTIKLKDGFFGTLKQLKIEGKNLYIVSFSDKENSDFERQPVVQILDEFGLLKLFDEVIIDNQAPKSEYVDKIDDGNSVFLDNDEKNIVDVSLHTNVDTINVKENSDVFSWYMKNMYIEAEIKSYDVDLLRQKIKEDIRLAKEDIYTERDDESNLMFRINLKNGEIVQVDRDYKSRNPHIYEGLKIPERILEKIRNIQHENFRHFNTRLNLLDKEQEVETSKLTDQPVDDILNNESMAKGKILESNLIKNENVDENKLEEFMNSSNVLHKFLAGAATSFLFLKNSGLIYQLEAKTLAEQIANFQVFGEFNGEEKFRLESEIDYIPSERIDKPLLEEDFINEEISRDNGISNVLRQYVQKVNRHISNGLYVYDNMKTKQFSEEFKNKFGHYIEQCAFIDSLTEKIYYKMQKIAYGFIE